MIIPPAVARLEKWCSRFPWAVRLYSLPYASVLEREIDLAEITEDDLVLNIGCGAVPFTALYIAERTGAHVHAVDIDPEAVACARRCAESFGLGHKITFEHAPGEQTECRNFTSAVTALQARPKKAVLAHLLAHGTEDVRIIVRRPQAHLHSQYDMLPDGYPITAEVMQHMKTFMSSVLYTRMPEHMHILEAAS